MAGNDDAIENVAVVVRPELEKGFSKNAKAKADAALAKVSTKIKLTADATGFNTRAKAALDEQAKLKNTPDYKIRLVADATGFNASAKVALARLRTGPTYKINVALDLQDNDLAAKVQAAAAAAGAVNVKVGIELDTDGLREKVKAASALAGGTVQVKVDVDRRGSAAVSEVSSSLRRATRDSGDLSKALQLNKANLIDFGGQGIRPMNLLWASAAALSPVLIAVGSSALQASTSIAALGSAGIGAALGIGGLLLAFKQITSALALRKTVQAQTDTADQNSTTQAVKNAAEILRQNNRILDTKADELKAEKDLHDARLKAARDLVDLRQKVADLQNQQSGDKVTLAEAQANLAKVKRDFFASALDRARAEQDVKDAQTKLSDTTVARKEATTDLASAVKKGVEGSDTVVNSRENLRQARERRAEALADAKGSTTALGAAAAKVTSPMAQLNALLAKMSPAARAMYNYFVKNSAELNRLRNIVTEGVLPGFTTFLNEITDKPKHGVSTLEFFARQAAELGAILGHNAALFGAFTRTPFFRSNFAAIQKNNSKALTIFGEAAQTLLKPLTRITRAASPLLVGLAKGFRTFADYLDIVTAKADKSGALTKFFDRAGDSAGKFLDIGINLARFLGNIFKLSLPTGDSLIDRLVKFTDKMASWSGSAGGQAKITAFFQFFKDLNYQQIGNFLTQAAGLFFGQHAITWLTGSPVTLFLSAMITLAASHPQGAIVFMNTLNTMMTSIIGVVTKHPEGAATVLAIFAAAKAARSLKLALDLPGLSKLGSVISGRFAGLSKMLGGGASTGTMTVRAAVVNVYGAAGVGGGGSTEIIGGGGGGGRGGGEEGGRPARGKKAAIGNLALIAGTTLGAYLVNQISTDGMTPFQKGMTDGLKGALDGAAIGSLFGPVGAVIGGVVGGVYGSYSSMVAKYHTAQGHENETFNLAGQDAYRYSFGGNVPVNDPTVVKRKAILDYIAARKASVAAEVAATKASQGATAADKEQVAENTRSAAALSTLLQKYGYTKDKADAYAKAVYGVNKDVYDQRVALGKLDGSFDGTGKHLDTATGKVKTLKTRLDEIDGKYVVTVTTDKGKYQEVYNDLINAVTLQEVLRSGKTPTTSNIGKIKHQIEDKNTFAGGGPVRGAGTATSDSIPAYLSNGEYVMPAKTVRHYGVDAMDRLRQRALPGFAKGGAVSLPFPVKMPVQQVAARTAGYVVPTGTGSTGAAIGDINVARIAEATARAMHASDKQLISLMEAGLVESGMRNLKYGDRDSLGFLQQRPSQGWGTPAQIMNVAHATRSFISRAIRDDQEDLTSGQLAQKVQGSAFPLRYDKRYGDAVAVLNLEAPYLAGFDPDAGYTGKIPKGLGKTGNLSAKVAQAVLGAHAAFPNVTVSSGYRKGANTVSGNKSYHSYDPSRAADFIPPSMSLFDYFLGRYGRTAKEIIYSPANGAQIKNGRPHMYGGAVRKGHFNHVHLALAQGGLVPARKYDTGGTLPPGFTMAYNGTGRNETIRTSTQEKALQGPMRLDRRDIVLLANHIANANNPTVHMDGRKVAEITNAYSYLPAGV